MKPPVDDRPSYHVTFDDGTTAVTSRASCLAEALGGWMTDRIVHVVRVGRAGVIDPARTASQVKNLTIDVRGMPELLSDLQARVGRLLREGADAEADPRVARRLREVAARVEVGL